VHKTHEGLNKRCP